MHFATPLPHLPVVLLLATWIGLFVSLRATRRSRFESLAIASVAWGACIWFLTELLSRTGHLNHRGVVVCWSLAALTALASGWMLQRRFAPEPEGPLRTPPASITDRLVIALLVVVLLGIAAVGLLTPIMDWDAQHYHIPRMLYWVQNGSIDHYPTANPRQLFMGPWPAFVQLHLYLLAGSDRLAHLLQWMCMVGSVALASAIARQLGGHRPAMITAAVLVATLPMGIMQAGTALTDYVTAFWLLVLVFLGLCTVSLDRISTVNQLAIGGALGLAVLTKGTAVPIAAPFVVTWIGVRLRRNSSSTWRTIVLASLVALALNASHFARNQKVFGHISGPVEHRKLVLNESFDPRLILSNLIRQTLVHIGTDDPAQARPQLAVSNYLHRILGVADGDPRNSHVGQTLHIAPMRRVDFLAGNPAHLLLYLVCGLWLCLVGFRRVSPRLLAYSACLLAAAILFVAMFKYQHTISRLQLPLFVLVAPACAVIVADHWSRKSASVITLLFLLLSIPWVFFAERRPLLGSRSILRLSQDELLYNMNGTYKGSAQQIAKIVTRRKTRVLGLITHGSSLEYFLWHELNQYGAMPDIVNLVPPEGLAPKPDVKPRLPFRPKYVAWLRVPTNAPPSIQIHRRIYHRKRYWRWGPDSLYERERPHSKKQR